MNQKNMSRLSVKSFKLLKKPASMHFLKIYNFAGKNSGRLFF
ncbi:Uncharacterized protein dnm_004330 [Desulfonema magnum]|uniref:Uncharacterized protein n=1 Tax=Desulfonema magnum TaxID=45655 RepID=A0A975BFF8_9BACT|nr:Uncharacterized protein dnm_004330 [Desulfonema magnum]